jgi:type VI secretion system secreted protein Hcp
MAVDMFIKIKDLPGESKDAKHKDEIDVLAWSWGLSQSAAGHMGGGAGSGKVNVQDLSFTKYIDKSSPNLMLYCCNGKHLADAKLTVRKAGENPLEYLTITMTDCLVSSISTGGSGGEDRLTENVTLHFSQVKVAYAEQDNKGGKVNPQETGWNISQNTKL